MRELPPFLSDFAEIRTMDYVYVDKTEFLYNLIKKSNPYFLSRPRRFGKSLLVSTLEAILSGQRELFKGLWIDGADYDWTPRPFISLSLYSAFGGTQESFERNMMASLRQAGQPYGIQVPDGDPVSAFRLLITDLYFKFNDASVKTYKGNKVAILIDEYDAPIFNELERPTNAEAVRRTLKAFYGVLKDTQKYWKFAFITGITKFTKTSIFSPFAIFKDLTLRNDCAAICGFTHEEFDESFSEILDASLDKFKANGFLPSEATTVDLRERMLELYDGYSWDGQTRVLNPWSVINCLDEARLGNYWFNSGGSPEFLVKLVERYPEKFAYLRPDKPIDPELNAIDIDVEKMDPPVVMFETGYLTVRTDVKSPGSKLLLDYPNLEVRASLLPLLLSLEKPLEEPFALLNQAKETWAAMLAKDPERFSAAFSAFLGNIRPDPRMRYEFYYKMSLFFCLAMVGIYADQEVPSGDGVTDIVVRIQETREIYILEFKYRKERQGLKEAFEAARRQIEARKYAIKFQGGAWRVFKVPLAVVGHSDVMIAFEEAVDFQPEEI
jgi:hypothetical protein